jgi:hypothetical protein
MVGPVSGTYWRSVGAMAATALRSKWYGPSPTEPSSGTTGLKASGWSALSRLKNDAWPTPSPPREWPTSRI